MSLIYWFIFTQVFQRSLGEEPYIVFLITALLPWVWFNAAVTDFTRAFNKDARLVRSTSIPRSIWVNRIVLSKGLEFLFSLPVLVLFAVFGGATVGWGRSEEHTSELQSLMRISYAVFCLKKNNTKKPLKT